MNTRLKAIKPDPAKPLHEMEMHEIVGRTFERQPLTPPHFPDHENLRPEVSYGKMKQILKRLSIK